MLSSVECEKSGYNDLQKKCLTSKNQFKLSDTEHLFLESDAKLFLIFSLRLKSDLRIK